MIKRVYTRQSGVGSICWKGIHLLLAVPLFLAVVAGVTVALPVACAGWIVKVCLSGRSAPDVRR